MADKKLESPKPSYGAFELTVLVLLVLGGATMGIAWINNNHEAISHFFNSLLFSLINIYAKYVVFSFFLSATLLILVVIYGIREREIRNKIMSNVLPAGGDKKTEPENAVVENPKWKLVQEHINSDDANKWKLGILEADIILSEVLDVLNLPGEGVGEKLKNVQKGDFKHIEEAWEAHKIRNAIAHEGSDFLLSQREAKRVIRLYQLVFEDFDVV